MAKRKANAVWKGNLKEGNGHLKLGSGLFEGAYTFASRFEDGSGTNPEELIGAALAGCYTMFLSNILAQDDYQPNNVDADATVHLGEVDGAPAITKIVLDCEGNVSGIDEATFREYADKAKAGCPVSKALAVDIELSATLSG